MRSYCCNVAETGVNTSGVVTPPLAIVYSMAMRSLQYKREKYISNAIAGIKHCHTKADKIDSHHLWYIKGISF